MQADRKVRRPPKSTEYVEFGYDREANLFFSKDLVTEKRVYVSHRRRLRLYNKGYAHRQSWILRDYQIPVDLLQAGDTVIDVGANIGELGMWVNAQGGRYIGFEPDPIAFSALQKNVTGDVFSLALSDKKGAAEFYLSTATADSSLFEPSQESQKISVQTVPLDDLMKAGHLPDKIKLIKVEAEGTEPEVLKGASETLSRVEYVAVDAGPERNGENTIPAVLNLLFAHGFQIIACYTKRGTFLLKKT